MAVVVFVIRRLAALAVVLAGVSFLIFALLAIAPGSPAEALLGTRPRTSDEIAAITAQYHLDDPLPVRYWHWLGGVLGGDLGRSIQSGQTVASMIGDHVGVTLELGGLALLVVLITGVPAGFVAGIRRGGRFDRGMSLLSVFALSAPAFAVGIVLIYLFGVRLSWLPVYGAGTGFVDGLRHLVLPVVTMAISLSALVIRQTRAAVRDVMDQDYVTFAKARGLPHWRVVIPYALRNSSLPIITTAGLLAIGAITGTVLAETVFAVPGIGSLLIGSIQARDIPVAQGVALLFALAVVLINLAVDLLVLVLDPRTRHPVGA
jgi:peptide/nickel transport system permease protein